MVPRIKTVSSTLLAVTAVAAMSTSTQAVRWYAIRPIRYNQHIASGVAIFDAKAIVLNTQKPREVELKYLHYHQ